MNTIGDAHGVVRLCAYERVLQPEHRAFLSTVTRAITYLPTLNSPFNTEFLRLPVYRVHSLPPTSHLRWNYCDDAPIDA